MNLYYPHVLQILINLIFHNLLYFLYLEKINYDFVFFNVNFLIGNLDIVFYNLSIYLKLYFSKILSQIVMLYDIYMVYI